MSKINIMACANDNCPMAEKCYRANKAHFSENQEKFNFTYKCNENSGFEDYISVKHFSVP